MMTLFISAYDFNSENLCIKQGYAFKGFLKWRLVIATNNPYASFVNFAIISAAHPYAWTMLELWIKKSID